MYEKILKILSNKLNLFHKVNLDLKSWRIILGPWLTFYTVCIFDKWETLRVLIKTQIIKKLILTKVIMKFFIILEQKILEESDLK